MKLVSPISASQEDALIDLQQRGDHWGDSDVELFDGDSPGDKRRKISDDDTQAQMALLRSQLLVVSQENAQLKEQIKEMVRVVLNAAKVVSLVIGNVTSISLLWHELLWSGFRHINRTLHSQGSIFNHLVAEKMLPELCECKVNSTIG